MIHCVFRRTLVGLSAALPFLFGATQVGAVPLTFFGEDPSTAGSLGPNSSAARSSFLSGLVGVGNEDFESYDVGAGATLSLSFPGSAGSIGADLEGTGRIENEVDYGRFATSGTQYWRASTGTFTIDFSDPVSAFGFNGIDIGDFVTEQMVLRLTDMSGEVYGMTVPHSLEIGNFDQSTLFFGFIDAANSYTSVEFTNAGGGDVFAFDDMVIGDSGQVTTVPEPGIIALFGAGIAGLAATRRRQQG